MSITELRSYRIMNIAVIDVVLSIIGLIVVFLLARKKWYPELDIKSFIIAPIFLAIPIGIFVHLIFGINTQLNYYIGLSEKP